MRQPLKSAFISTGVLRCVMPFLLLYLLCLLCSVPPAAAEGAKRIVKWKDEHGVTHYGDSIPPQYVDRDNALMNSQGIIIQQNKPSAQQDKEAEAAKQEQAKKDRALLGTFSNAEEIDLTRDRNLEPELLAMKNLQQDRAVAQKKADKSKAAAEAFLKSKKTVPAWLVSQQQTNNDDLVKINTQIHARQQTIDSIRKRFEEDKKRYLELKNKAPLTPDSLSNPS